MTSPHTITPITGVPHKLGSEDTNQEGLDAITRYIEGTGDYVIHHTTFDFGGKVLALTLQGIVLADSLDPEADDGLSISACTYENLRSVAGTGHEREIRLVFEDGDEVTWRMRDNRTVTRLKDIILQYQQQFLNNGNPRLWEVNDEDTPAESSISSQSDQRPEEGDDPPPIAERVRFWQEQDKINQVLIPRVIRQNELLTKHIAEHGDLPQLLGRVISEALTEQAAQYETALEKASTEMSTAYNEALTKAKEQQEQDYKKAVDRVQEQARKFRKLLIVITSCAVAAAVIAVVIAILA